MSSRRNNTTIDLRNLFPEGVDGSRKPLPKQQLFIDRVMDANGPSNVAYYGGYGSGKSLILCIVNIMQGVLYGGDYVIARQYMPELRRTTYKVFKELLPKELIIEDRIADAEITIKSAQGKATFYFVGLDEPQKLDSLNLSGASIDEASQTTEEAMLKLQGRLRNKKGLRKLIMVGNPRGHDFVYRYFIKQDVFKDLFDPVTKRTITADEQKRRWHMIVAPSTENVHLPPDYVANMLATYSAERVQRDIMGSFDSFEGAVYPEFRRDVHVIQPFAIPAAWTRVVGADHGYRNPAAWLWGAISPDGDVYVYREFYEREWLIEEICKRGKDGRKSAPGRMDPGEKIEALYIDPATGARRGADGLSDLDHYLEHLPKTLPVIKANNSVTAGIDMIKTMLKPDSRGKPRLYIFNTCQNTIDEITSYRYAELAPGREGLQNDKETPQKVNDHLMDSLRYMVMSRPELAPIKPNPYEKIKYNSLEGALFRDLQRLKRGNAGRDPFGDL